MENAQATDSGDSFVFRKLDPNQADDITQFCPIFWEYWWNVNQEDISDPVKDEKLNITIPRTEAMLYAYLAKGFCVQLCQKGEEIVGFMIFHIACDHFLEVRGCYVDKAYEGKKLMKGFVNSLEKPIRRIVFQTRIEHAPERFMEVTKMDRREVARTEHLITWEMDWRT